ncbi:MAG: septum formation protein Maf [Acidobacteria bacterium]|nr:septum formation protein Maf [Acidobacteriota bacterium]
MHLYLASASPRRMTLLREAGYRPERVAQEAPEERLPGETPEGMVRRVARAKALWAVCKLTSVKMPGIVLAADTAVVLAGEVLGKPESAEVAREMLRRLNGRRHRVLTSVALVRSDDRREAGGVETTHVEFRAVSENAIDRYVAGGSPLDKAGAYGIQDLDETWIAGIDGLRSNVVGLPVERLADWISALKPRS